jgi:AdoMet-dependent heme synthase
VSLQLQSIADIERVAFEKFIPLRAIAEITYRCNFGCPHCYVRNRSERNELTYVDWCGVLDELARLGCLELTFSGGEPLTRNDFFKIAEAARERAFAIRLFTNGSLLDSAALENITELGFLSVDISLYGANPETYRRITGDENNYRKAVNAIDSLLNLGIITNIKIPLIDLNYCDYEQMLDFCRVRELTPLVDPKMTLADGGDSKPRQHEIDPQLWKPCLEKAGRNPGNIERDPEQPVCNAGRSTMTINPYGDVYPCIEVRKSAGNVGSRGLSDIWKNSEFLQEIRELKFGDFEHCSACELATQCRFCPGSALADCGSLKGIDRGACLEAHQMAKREASH